MGTNNNAFDPKDRANNDNNKNQDVKNDAAKHNANEQEVAVAEAEEVDPIEYYGL